MTLPSNPVVKISKIILECFEYFPNILTADIKLHGIVIVQFAPCCCNIRNCVCLLLLGAKLRDLVMLRKVRWFMIVLTILCFLAALTNAQRKEQGVS